MKYKTKILVVDDDLPVCTSIKNTLQGEGYTVEIALSGEDALEKEKGNKYSIMIVDLMMPGIDGIELLKEVKKKNTDTTVIMITGYPSITSAVQSIKLGAFDFIPKPFTPKDLVSMVSRALDRRYLYEEVAEEMGLKEKRLVEIDMPSDIYCIPENSWLKVEKDGNVRIGIHHVFIRTLKDILSINFPKLNEFKYQGETCFEITDSQNRTHRLWSPVTGKVIDINKKIKVDYTELLNDPYHEGWVLLIEPVQLDEDLKSLQKSGNKLR